MNVSGKKSLNKRLLSLITILYLCSLGHSCSIIRNITTREAPAVLPRPESTPPFRQAIATLSFNARINVRSPEGDVTLSAYLHYTGMDSAFIQIRDPLKRQLAQFTLNNHQYHLWLQRENRHLSGTELPETIGHYTIPQIPLQDLTGLLIGQIEQPNAAYHPVYDRYRRLIRLTPKSGNGTIFTYADWNLLGKYYWIPQTVNLNFGKEVKITIQYSQFQVEFRKLA